MMKCPNLKMLLGSSSFRLYLVKCCVKDAIKSIQRQERGVRLASKDNLRALAECYAIIVGVTPHSNPKDKRS